MHGNQDSFHFLNYVRQDSKFADPLLWTDVLSLILRNVCHAASSIFMTFFLLHYVTVVKLNISFMIRNLLRHLWGSWYLKIVIFLVIACKWLLIIFRGMSLLVFVVLQLQCCQCVNDTQLFSCPEIFLFT